MTPGTMKTLATEGILNPQNERKDGKKQSYFIHISMNTQLLDFCTET